MKQLRVSLNPFRRLQWRLTFSYTLVTVAALAVLELIFFGAFLAFVGSDFVVNLAVRTFQDEIASQAQIYLASTPPDLEGLNRWATGIVDTSLSQEQSNLRITRGFSIDFDQDRLFFILDRSQNVLAQVPPPGNPADLGQPFDTTLVREVDGPLQAALAGDDNLDHLYKSLPDGTLVMALPIKDQGGELLGVMITTIVLPALNLETLGPVFLIVLISLVPFTLAAGLIGTFFGFLTARGLSRRLANLAQAVNAWSRGKFSVVAADRSDDELGQLTGDLNLMAEQLQNLLQTRQELAALEERNRLARELHDSVKQQVFATTMQIGAARAKLPANPEAAANHLDEAELLARRAQKELATLIRELRPAALDGRGLRDALKAYTADWSRRTGIEAQIRPREWRPLALAVEQELFRVTQEALTNVAKHSGASIVEIDLFWKEYDVTLSIIDNGRGFDAFRGEPQGFGLQSMRERVESLGGQLLVESEPGAGTKVIVQVKGNGQASGGEENERTDHRVIG